MSHLTYIRAACGLKPGLAPGQRIPHLERTTPAAVADEGLLTRFRQLTRYPDDGLLPITWPQAVAFATHLENLVDPRFPLPLMGTLHVRTRIVQHRPVGAGELLRAVCSIEGQRPVDLGWEFDLETRAYVGPDLVWEGWATMLRLAPQPPTPRTGVDRPPLDGLGAVNHVWHVPACVAREFAAVTGDLNPIHLSALTARLFGFKGVVAHGLWSLSRAAGEHPDLVRLPGVELVCQFKKPVLLPAPVVSRHWPERSGQGVQLRLLDGRAEKPHLIGRLGLP